MLDLELPGNSLPCVTEDDTRQCVPAVVGDIRGTPAGPSACRRRIDGRPQPTQLWRLPAPRN